MKGRKEKKNPAARHQFLYRLRFYSRAHSASHFTRTLLKKKREEFISVQFIHHVKKKKKKEEKEFKDAGLFFFPFIHSNVSV